MLPIHELDEYAEVQITPLEEDIVISGRQYQAYIIPEYPNKLGYMYVHPRGEKFSYRKLVPYNGVGCQWGMKLSYDEYLEPDGTTITSSYTIEVTRNGRGFGSYKYDPEKTYVFDAFEEIRDKIRVASSGKHSLQVSNFGWDFRIVDKQVQVGDIWYSIIAGIGGQLHCYRLDDPDRNIVQIRTLDVTAVR